MSAWLVTLIVGIVVSALGGLLLLMGTAEWIGVIVTGVGGAATFTGLIAAGVWMGTRELRR